MSNPRVTDDSASRIEERLCTTKASQHYGSIRTVLETRGQVIGVNDLHIADHARSEGLILVTNNTAEFVRVPALMAINNQKSIHLYPIFRISRRIAC